MPTGFNVERRSIEFIPENERYGHPRRLFSFWFSCQMQVSTLVVGTLGIAAGLNLAWTALAIILGNVIGTIFMAGHSAQGPHLGIPQMIQSRAQFGVLGAAIPLIIVVIIYVLFNAANAVVMRDSIKAVLPIGNNAAIIGFGAVTIAIGFVGYELIHKMGALMSIVSSIVFMIAALTMMTRPLPIDALHLTAAAFRSGAFMLVVTQAASWTLGFGPTVADYSRYLSPRVSTWRTFWYTYVGTLLGATLMMLLGALLATSYANMTQDPGTGIASLFGRWSTVAQIVIVVGVVELNVLNLYSAYMATVTIYCGFNALEQISRRQKFIVMGMAALAATLIGLATQYHFNEYFADILNAQIYVLVPWSSINLADYYLVRDGKYSIVDIFSMKGIYGKYNMSTLVIYFVAVASTVPFMDVSFYHSYFAKLLNADISWIPALVVPGTLYYLVHRHCDRPHFVSPATTF